MARIRGRSIIDKAFVGPLNIRQAFRTGGQDDSMLVNQFIEYLRFFRQESCAYWDFYNSFTSLKCYSAFNFDDEDKP